MLALLKELAISKTGKDTGIVFFSTAVNVLAGGLFFALVPRFLGPADYGIFSTVVATGLLTVSVANLGIDTGILRFTSKAENRDVYLSIALKSYIILGFTISIISIFFTNLIASFLKQPEIAPLLRIAFSTTTLLLLANYFTASLQAKSEFTKASFVNITSNFFRLILLAIGALFFTVNLYFITLLFFLIPVVSLIIGYFLDPVKFVKSESKQVTAFFGYNLPIAISLIISAIPIDNYLLLKISGPIATGIYAAPFKILTFSYQFGGNFTRVMASRLSTINSKKDLFNFSKTISPVLLLFLIGVLIVGIFSKPIIIILFGRAFLESAVVMQILAIGFAAFLINTLPSSIILYYFGKSNIALAITVAKYILFVLLLYSLVPVNGQIGAAISFSISEVFALALMTFYIVIKLKNDA